MDGAGISDPFGLVGTVLERKYRIDRVVAEGGFGIVYAGHHMALDLPVAVKVLKRRSEVDNDAWQDLLARFVQEAQTMARLRHPNVVSVLDTGVAQVGDWSLPWMVLEWLDGVTLKDDLLARRGYGGRSPREALELLRPVIEAVAEAHHERVAHRDLKPSNIALVPGRRGGVTPRVLDFGVAKVMEGDVRASSGHTTTDEGFRAFSRGYAAPEQLAGARTGPWTDVHALGLILTELLVDAAPLADEPTEQHARAFDPMRPTPARFEVEVGPLEEVIAQAVALRPADRFADAGELLAALDAAMPERVSGAPVVRDGSAEGVMTGGSRRRRSGLVAGAAVGALLVAGGAIAAIAAANGGEQPDPYRASVPQSPSNRVAASAGNVAGASAEVRVPVAPVAPSASLAPVASATTAFPPAAPRQTATGAPRPSPFALGPVSPEHVTEPPPLEASHVDQPTAALEAVPGRVDPPAQAAPPPTPAAPPPPAAPSGRPRYTPE